MAKLRLDLDALVVETFHTISADGAGRGTVAANQVGVDAFILEAKETQSNCHSCHYTILESCLSCDRAVCTIASQTECPSCLESCNGCGPTCACPVEPVPVPVQPRGA